MSRDPEEHGHPQPPASTVGVGAEEVFRAAEGLGKHRLARPARAILMDAFIGGLYVTFSGLGALTLYSVLLEVTAEGLAWTLASLLYPVGFLFVIFGEAELFTENFLTPIAATRETSGPWGQVARLWAFALIGNLAGVSLMAAVWAEPAFGLLRAASLEVFATHAADALAQPAAPVFMRAVFAGMLINFMTWLVLSSRGHLAKVVLITITTYLVMFLDLAHAIVSSFELLVGLRVGGGALATYAIRWLPLAVLGNAVGGTLFVGALFYARAKVERGSMA